MKRFFAGVVALIVLTSCKGQRENIDPWPSHGPIPVPTASLSRQLINWSDILETFASSWAARPDVRQVQLKVIAASIVEPAELGVCAGPHQFDHTAKFLAYCRAAVPIQPADAGPDGVVLIPHQQFMHDIALLRTTNSEQITYETLVVTLALFYADHLIGEAERLGLLPQGHAKEQHRYCLAGGVVRSSTPRNRVSLATIHQTLSVAMPFVEQHRAGAMPERALDWFLRGLNSGSQLEPYIMCS